MTASDRLSRERLECLALPYESERPLLRKEDQFWATADEERAMAQEILELRDRIDAMQSVLDAYALVSDFPVVEPQPDKIQQTPDPAIVQLRQRLDMIEQLLTKEKSVDLRPTNLPGIQIYF